LITSNILSLSKFGEGFNSCGSSLMMISFCSITSFRERLDRPPLLLKKVMIGCHKLDRKYTFGPIIGILWKCEKTKD